MPSRVLGTDPVVISGRIGVQICHTGTSVERRVALAMADLAALRIERAPHGPLIRRCRDLRPNLTVDDASYVALAEAIDAVVVTGDRRLADAPGVRCTRYPVEVLG